MKAIKKEILLLLFVGFVLTGGCNKNSYSDIGVCDKSLFETVDEKGVLSIIINLKMENYIPEHELTENEIEEQREAIKELQEKFLESLESLDYSLGRKGEKRPWISLTVTNKTTTEFICNSEMVDTVSINEPHFTQD